MPKTANPTKCFEEDFLCAVGRVRYIAEHAQNQVIDGTVIVGDQPIERGFGIRLQFGYQPGFVTAPG